MTRSLYDITSKPLEYRHQKKRRKKKKHLQDTTCSPQDTTSRPTWQNRQSVWDTISKRIEYDHNCPVVHCQQPIWDKTSKPIEHDTWAYRISPAAYMEQHKYKEWGRSSVGRASNRHAADAGSIPRCTRGVFSQSQHSVQTLLRCPYTPCAIACIYLCAQIKDPIVHDRVRWIRKH